MGFVVPGGRPQRRGAAGAAAPGVDSSAWPALATGVLFGGDAYGIAVGTFPASPMHTPFVASKVPLLIVSSALLAIVTVDKKDQVMCDQPGCKHKHYVSQRVHIVESGEAVQRLGRECFKEIYGKGLQPRYEAPEKVSGDKADLLKNNVVGFIALIKKEFLEKLRTQRQIEMAEKQRAALAAPARRYINPLTVERPKVDIDTG